MGKDIAPLLIGLTGPIGCGKSTVANILGELGGTVIDADRLARQVTEPGGPAIDEVRAAFDERVVDDRGALDRAALAEIVFKDAAALADLERIVHPHVRKLVDATLTEAASQNVPFVALEAIKLVEGGLAARCDEVWLVNCVPSIQRQRLRDRGATTEDIERRISAQGADLVTRLGTLLGDRSGVRELSTDGSLAQTRGSVEDALADALEAFLEKG